MPASDGLSTRAMLEFCLHRDKDAATSAALSETVALAAQIDVVLGGHPDPKISPFGSWSRNISPCYSYILFHIGLAALINHLVS
jgi:hypothetical protein